MSNIITTTIQLEEDLVNEAMSLSGYGTKRSVIENALREFVMTRRKKNLMDLKGQIEFSEGYDYKEARRDRSF